MFFGLNLDFSFKRAMVFFGLDLRPFFHSEIGGGLIGIQ